MQNLLAFPAMPLIRTALRPRGVVFADLFFVLAVLAFLFAAVLAMAQDGPAPSGGPAAVVEWSDAMAKAGGWGVAVIFGVVIAFMWRENKALNAQVVKILQDFLGQHKG